MPGTIFLGVILEQQSRIIFIAFVVLGGSEMFTKMPLPRVKPQSTARADLNQAEKPVLIVNVPSNKRGTKALDFGPIQPPGNCLMPKHLSKRAHCWRRTKAACWEGEPAVF